MKKLIYAALLFLLSLQAMAQTIKEGDELISKESITFLSHDGQGIANIADWFRDKIILKPGYIFKVTELYQSCKTKNFTGSYVTVCKRSITMEANSCGIEATAGNLEQIRSFDFKLNLRVENGHCIVRITETDDNAGIPRTMNTQKLSKNSLLKDHFILIKQ